MKDDTNAESDARRLAGEARIQRADPIGHDMLTVALRWLPYGGPPDEEILVQFGMTRERYLDRLCALVRHYRNHLYPETAAQLLLMCIIVDDESPVVATDGNRAMPQRGSRRVAPVRETGSPPRESNDGRSAQR